MSREQWGHGYWKGVEDAQFGRVRTDFQEEVKFWIAHMCCSNYEKSFDRSLFPVQEFIFYCDFCGVSEKFAKKVYDYILNKEDSLYEFRKDRWSWCYVTGDARNKWHQDYFVIPVSDYALEEWQSITDALSEKLTNGGYTNAETKTTEQNGGGDAS